MFQRLNEMRERREAGFTLIELMVVVLIIAILIAIAIPTFLGLRERAQDSGTKSNLRNGLTAAKAHYTDAQTFTGFTGGEAGVGDDIEPSLDWDDLAVTVAGTPAGSQVTITSASESGTVFCIRDNAASGTTFGSGVDATAAAAACTNTKF